MLTADGAEQRIKELIAPENFWITQRFILQFRKVMAYYRCAMMEIETKCNVLNEEFSLQYDRNPINGMKTRLKSMESIRQKLERKGLPMAPETVEEHIHDVAGVRVICAFPEDVYRIADALLAQDDIVLLKKKDYIQNPKPNGYRSLHLIVSVPIFLAREKRMMKVEIQLRTIAMDFWASLEHQMRYKKTADFSDGLIKELKICAELSAELDARMDKIRASVQPKEEKAASDT
ncbi:MAG: GTP pyrophosphokinase family protein [Ruminococcaceae bacterium]|nr:GTP pyrophosphokinase family protein [Oscillospiraceae bacterium]